MDDHELAARLATRCNALAAENAALREIAQAVAETGGYVDDDDVTPEELIRRIVHAPNCPVTHARALLADTLDDH